MHVISEWLLGDLCGQHLLALGTEQRQHTWVPQDSQSLPAAISEESWGQGDLQGVCPALRQSPEAPSGLKCAGALETCLRFEHPVWVMTGSGVDGDTQAAGDSRGSGSHGREPAGVGAGSRSHSQFAGGLVMCSTAEAGAQFLLSRRPSQLCCLLAKFFTSQHSDLTLGLHLPVC